MQAGPILRKFTLSQHWCTGCQWLKVTQKQWLEATDCFHPKWDGPFPGRSLGGSVVTPDWCPYLPPDKPVSWLEPV